ncbi:monocarboxylate transporter 13-like [Haliotis cracherodii]|uniref:monocarboxylate transporter 13-like n=1 Tax=Haliotis cracherodii TaxID=6455 RepID=UPI0039EC23C1
MLNQESLSVHTRISSSMKERGINVKDNNDDHMDSQFELNEIDLSVQPGRSQAGCPSMGHDLRDAYQDRHCDIGAVNQQRSATPLSNQNASNKNILQGDVNVYGYMAVEGKVYYHNPGYMHNEGETVMPGISNGNWMEDRHEIQVVKNGRPRRFFPQLVAILGCCFNVFLAVGLPYSLGALFVDWLDAFQTTRAQTASIQSTAVGLTFMGGFVNGFLVVKFGTRTVMFFGSIVSSLGLITSWFATSYVFLVVSIGVVMGIGCSMVYLGSLVTLSHTFHDPRSKSIALSIMTSSAGVGSMVFPIVLKELKETYGWRGALLLASGGLLNITSSCLLVTQPHQASPTLSAQHEKTTSKNEKEKSKYQHILNPMYGACLVCAMVGFGILTSTSVTAVDFGMSKGLSYETGLVFLLLINGLGAAMRFLVGLIQMVPGVKTYQVLCMSVLLSSASLVALSLADTYGMIVGCFSLLGLAAGGMVGSFPMVIHNLVGEDKYAVAIGFGSAMSGFSSMTMGILIGTLYDLTGSYDLSFLILGCIGVGASFLPVIIRCLTTIGTHMSVTISHQ